MLFIAGGFYAATAAAQPAINVGSGNGNAGSTATFSVTLSSGGAQVAGTQNDIAFDSNTPVRVGTNGYCAITTTTQCSSENDCPDLPAPFTGKEPCIPANGPNCSVNPAIGKGGFFSFLPNGCTPTTLGDCTGIRALIVAVDNLNVIPDGSTLYTCTVQIAQGTADGDYPLTISNEKAGDPSQQPFNEACVDGHCAVTTSQSCQTLADCPSIVTGTNGMITVPGGVTPFLVCDVAPSTGDNAGQFGNDNINNTDVVAIFKASLQISPPAAGTARFSAMDSAPVDVPPACGGNATLANSDVVTCFKESLLPTQARFTRTLDGETCTSAQVPQ